MKIMEDDYCFACGKLNPIGLKLDIKSINGKALCKVKLAKQYQGYKDIVHGGIIATILDEVMVYALFSLEYKVLTTKLEIKYRKSVPVEKDLIVEAIIIDKTLRHNRIKAKAEIKDDKGNVLAQARGEYAIV